MTKTKAQLRAEAVERLKSTAHWLMCAYAEGKTSVVWETRDRHDGSKSIGQMMLDDIDLLTDDEPPEGDVVAIMRKVATCGECTGYTMRKEVGSIDWADALLILADMIERDYVRRDSLTDDEPVNGKKPDSLSLTTEDEAVNCKKPDSLQDTREKLEAEVREYIDSTLTMWDEERAELCDNIICWLDRQAAITERERERHWLEIVGASANCNLELFNRNAELQEKVDELEAEKQRITRELGKHVIENVDFKKKMDALEEENRLMRERLRSMADNDVTVFGMKLDDVRNLQAENAELREKYMAVRQCIPLLAKDGKPIVPGQTLYGGDGRDWLVVKIETDGSYPVHGTCNGVKRRLKAEWHTHEKPDCMERVIADLRNNGIESIADRIERLVSKQ